jgi:hypothetical protein
MVMGSLPNAETAHAGDVMDERQDDMDTLANDTDRRIVLLLIKDACSNQIINRSGLFDWNSCLSGTVSTAKAEV